MRFFIVVAAFATLAIGTSAHAQDMSPAATMATHRAHATMQRHHVKADGRCDGISYGTGARSCGTMTGGPVGGLNSRN